MAIIKLFRSTGYSTILAPGEARLAPHPRRLIAGASIWIALVANPALWRALQAPSSAAAALASALVAAGLIGMLLSVLGWRRTLRKATTLLLLLSAVAAAGQWMHGAETAHPLLDGLASLPDWPHWFAWPPIGLVAVLGVLPVYVVYGIQLRRLSGPEQLRANLGTLMLAALVTAAGGILSAAMATG